MPDPHLLPGFLLAVIALMLIPGPNVALIVATSLGQGSRRGVLTALATSSASVVQLLLVSFGMASAVSRLGHWFVLFRWAGVAYLILIGIQQWRAPLPAATEHGQPNPRSIRSIFAKAAIVSILNPKTLLFYAAFFPQFLSADRPIGPQLAVLATIYILLAIIVDCSWAIGAGRFRALLSTRARLFNRVSGGVLIGAGMGLALDRNQ